MGDYKWIAYAAIPETCCLCKCGIAKGDGLYFEREKREIYCVKCGRAIRAKGEKVARQERGKVGGFGEFDSLFRSVFGSGHN